MLATLSLQAFAGRIVFLYADCQPVSSTVGYFKNAGLSETEH